MIVENMKKSQIQPSQVLFEVFDVFGKKVRTTKIYWKKISQEKHPELTVHYDSIIEVLQNPDEVYKSVVDDFIKIFYKKINGHTLVVVVKYIQEYGFVVTTYETSKLKKKGEQLWPKQK